MDTGQITTGNQDAAGRIVRQVKGGAIVPLSKYDPQYGGRAGSAVKAMKAMQRKNKRKAGQ